MYYRIKDIYRLRGWQHSTCVLITWFGKIVKALTPEEFSLLLMCDGVTALDNNLNEEEKETLKQMLSNGWIDALDEPNPLTEQQNYRFFDNRYFSSVLWSITGQCNFKCRHCYLDAPSAHLGEQTLDEMLNTIDQLADCGIYCVDLTGGEPFVRSDFWEIVEHLMKRGIAIGKIYTNGWLLNEEILNRFDLYGRKVAFSFSFDGLGWHDWMRGVEGAEERTIRAIKLCINRGFPADVEMCLHAGNASGFRDTVNYLASIGIQDLKVATVVNTPLWQKNADGNAQTREEYFETIMNYIPFFFQDKMPMHILLGSAIELFKESKKYRIVCEKGDGQEEHCSMQYLCNAARMSAYISPEGRFLPCMAIASSKIQDRFPLIRDLGVKQCISDSYYMNFIAQRVKTLFTSNTKCEECEFRYRCCGGCRANAILEEEDGDLFSVDQEACFLFENGYPDKFHKAADEAIAKYCEKES